MSALQRWVMASLMLALVPVWACTRGTALPGSSQAQAYDQVACGLTGIDTGRGRGYIIHRDGRVEAWSGRSMSEGVASRGEVPADAVAALWASVHTAIPSAQDQQVVGAPAAFLQGDGREGSERVSWPVGPGAAQPDTTLKHAFDLCNQTAGAAE